MVAGDDGPTIVHLFDIALTGVDHGFDGEHHAGLELFQRTRFAVVQDLRFLMKNLTDTVTTKFADDRKTMSFGKHLNCMADVT